MLSFLSSGMLLWNTMDFSISTQWISLAWNSWTFLETTLQRKASLWLGVSSVSKSTSANWFLMTTNWKMKVGSLKHQFWWRFHPRFILLNPCLDAFLTFGGNNFVQCSFSYIILKPISVHSRRLTSGAEHVANVLSDSDVLPNLTELSLSSNEIGNDGAKAIVESLTGKNKMTRLNLNSNKVSESQIEELIEILEKQV